MTDEPRTRSSAPAFRPSAASQTPRSRRDGSARRGWTAPGAAAVILFFLVIVVGMIWFAAGGPRLEEAPRPVVAPVRHIDYVHEIVVKGAVESGNNRDVACEFEYLEGWRPRIVEVVEEGAFVEQGDVVLRLDSSELDDLIRAQNARCREYEALVVRARSRVQVAKLRLREYRNGDYALAAVKAESSLRKAEERMEESDRSYKAAETLYRRGYITAQQLEAEAFALETASNALESARIAVTVLDEYSQKKRTKELESDIAAAEASLQAMTRIAMRGEERLAALEAQLDNCVIRAPTSGYVVLAHLHHHGHSHWVRVGEPVRPGRTVIKLPDPTRMQVVADIEESLITVVEPGQPVTIRFDALPGVAVTGVVLSVGKFPEETHWWGPGIKRFETIIEIDPDSVKRNGLSLRPGLTARASILVEEAGPRVQIPMQAIVFQDDMACCLTYDRGEFRARRIETGASNGRFVVVESGLEPGDSVVLAAERYLDQADLTELAGNDVEDAGVITGEAQDDILAPVASSAW